MRQALDYDNTGRAVAVCLIGWIIQIVVAGLLGGLLFYGGDNPGMTGGAI